MTAEATNHWGSIALGVRIGRAPNAYFFRDWTRLIAAGTRECDLILDPAHGLPHVAAANKLVDDFLKTDCDTLAFFDDDMTFPVDSLERLRTAGEWCDVLSGLYCMRNPPHVPLVLMRQPDGNLRCEDFVSGGVVACDVVGLGFTLVRRRQLSEGCFAWYGGQGEDGRFCADVQARGGKVACHTGVLLGHRSEMTVTWQDRKAGVR